MMRLASAILLATLPLCAQEAVIPDSIAAQSGFTDCTIGEIDEDPDAPDASWCDVNGANNVGTEVRVTFNSPSGNPSGTQEFRVQFRKTNHSTDPTCLVDLYENGSEIAAGVIASTAVSSTTGTVLSGTWDASSLGTADGSLVEARMACTTGGGNPGNRASGEVGAVEWIATTGSAPATGAATLDMLMTLDGTGEAIALGDGSLDQQMTLSGTGTRIGIGEASLDSALSLSGTGARVGVGGSSLDSTLSISASGERVGVGQSSLDSTLTLSAIGSPLGSGQASLDNTLTLSGTGTRVGIGAATLTGVWSLTGEYTGMGIASGKSSLSGRITVRATEVNTRNRRTHGNINSQGGFVIR